MEGKMFKIVQYKCSDIFIKKNVLNTVLYLVDETKMFFK